MLDSNGSVEYLNIYCHLHILHSAERKRGGERERGDEELGE